MMLPKYMRVLNALRNGANVQVGGIALEIDVAEDGREYIGVPGQRTVLGRVEAVMMPYDISLNDFIAQCEQLEEADIPIVVPALRSRS